MANPKDNFLTTSWDAWWAIILVVIQRGNEGEKACVMLYLSVDTVLNKYYKTKGKYMETREDC